MEITTPEMKTSGTSKLEEAINKFEKSFRQDDQDQAYYHLIIVGEYNREVCDEIQRLYTLAGWNNVTCKTSSENGERGELTGLELFK